MIDYIKEIKDIIVNNPKNFIKVLKSKGSHKGIKSNEHLIKYIEENTPLLKNTIYALKTKIYWILNHIKDWSDEKVCCKVCKKPFININIKKLKDGYKQTCSKECERKLATSAIEKTMLEKYSVKNAFQIKHVKDDISNRKDEIYNKIQDIKTKRYNNACYNNSEKAKNTKLNRYGSIWNIQKIQNTKENKYGNKNWNNPEKNFGTKKINQTFNTSTSEKILKLLFEKTFKTVQCQFKSNKYPFACDFYIEEHNLYVEYNGSWTHGTHPFDENNQDDLALVEKWKSKNSKYYDNAIETWTKRDVLKRKTAIANKLNYIELWNMTDVMDFLSLYIQDIETFVFPDLRKINEQFMYLKNKDLKNKPFPHCNNKNFIVKYFQQDIFYKKEKTLFKDKKIRNKLIENRCKYLNKKIDELTALDILDGFKKSGIFYGYSHFNPLWFKWFIQKYGINTCYDPCGGWGHRLLGSTDLDLYVYNDFSASTKMNIDVMVNFFKMKHVVAYCNDAKTFIPKENFEAMFTCPPYFNLEHYECSDFKDIMQFENFIDCLFNVFHKKQDCKIFGLVIREDMLFSHTNFNEKILLNSNSSHLNTNKNINEYLFIYHK